MPSDAMEAHSFAANTYALVKEMRQKTFDEHILRFMLDQLHLTYIKVYAAITKTESPIEAIVFIEMEMWKREFPSDEQPAITPQYQAGDYRLDFLVEYKGLRFAVECDGHDFHERTKEQAKRDKKRDRDLSLQGYHVVRFTGSEIWTDPRAVTNYLNDAISRHASSTEHPDRE